jgi:hypothetical protein
MPNNAEEDATWPADFAGGCGAHRLFENNEYDSAHSAIRAYILRLFAPRLVHVASEPGEGRMDRDNDV